MGSWNSLKYILIYSPYMVSPKVNLFIISNPLQLSFYNKPHGKFSYKNQTLIWGKNIKHIKN